MKCSPPRPIRKESKPTFRTVLRLRPLLSKREQDSTLVSLETVNSTTVALHPFSATTTSPLLSPSSVLVRQTVHKTEQDKHYSFHHIFGAAATQDDVYFGVGHNAATQSMEGLLRSHNTHQKPTSQNQLILGMGLKKSGITYTCWGDNGLVPHILESLFAQSQHLACSHHFGVQMTLLQVNQQRHGTSECYDLLQPLTRRHHRRVGYASLEDDRSADQRTRVCRSLLEAQQSLRTARRAIKQLTNTKKYDCHIYCQLTPVLDSSKRHKLKRGSHIVLLDMASRDAIPKSTTATTTARSKDYVCSHDAHFAVLQCLSAFHVSSPLLQDRPIPFVQHKVTRLLKPLFTSSTQVTLLLTASLVAATEHEYRALQELLEQVQVYTSDSSRVDVVTGQRTATVAVKQELQPKSYHHYDHTKKRIVATVVPSKHHTASDADDERSPAPPRRPRAHVVAVRKHQPLTPQTMTGSVFSDDDDVSLPPPMVPGYVDSHDKQPPSAPVECSPDSDEETLIPPPPPQAPHAVAVGIPVLPKKPLHSTSTTGLSYEVTKQHQQPNHRQHVQKQMDVLNEDTDDSEIKRLQSRIRELEATNAKLVAQVQELQQEKDSNVKREPQQVVVQHTTTVVQKHQLDKENNSDSFLDNPLFQHMAELGRKR